MNLRFKVQPFESDTDDEYFWLTAYLDMSYFEGTDTYSFGFDELSLKEFLNLYSEILYNAFEHAFGPTISSLADDPDFNVKYFQTTDLFCLVGFCEDPIDVTY